MRNRVPLVTDSQPQWWRQGGPSSTTMSSTVYVFVFCFQGLCCLWTQGVAVSWPPDTGLGAVPYNLGHGTCRVCSQACTPILIYSSTPDTSRHPETLCSAASSIYAKKAISCRYSRTVRTVYFRFYVPDRVKRQFCARRALARSQILRTTSAFSPIPPPSYMSISNHLSDAFTTGSYLKDGPPKSDAPSTPPNPMSDPAAMDGMMSGMKTQMVMMVPQMIIMGWINFFFQGFVLSA